MNSRNQGELRRKRRQTLRYSANILLNQQGGTRACSILDISESGARLSTDDEAELPDQFILLLDKTGNARRICRLVWREGTKVGVKFVRSAEQDRKVI